MGGRVVRWCWVNFQWWGVLLIWIIVGQGPTALVVGAGGGCLDIFPLIYHFSFLSPSLWETARYRLKYCLKGPLDPNQPTTKFKNTMYTFLKTKWLSISFSVIMIIKDSVSTPPTFHPTPHFINGKLNFCGVQRWRCSADRRWYTVWT